MTDGDTDKSDHLFPRVEAEPEDAAQDRPDAADLLSEVTLLAALKPSQVRALRAGAKRLSAVVIVAPTAEWVSPLAHAARKLAAWDHVVVTTDTRPSRKEEKAREVVRSLAAGGRVVGISSDPAGLLPACLVSAADLTVTTGVPDNRALATAIALVLGRRPRRLPPALCLGLDYNDIVSAIRLGTTPSECVRRLTAAKTSKTFVDPALAEVPTLDGLHGYGSAMEWCKALVTDLDAWRRGEAPFPSDTRVVLSGPPGTGKTTLVRSLARTAGLPLVATSVGSWFASSSGNLDGVIKEIARVWDLARALGTAVVLLDELDALPNRSTMDNRGRDWWTPVVTYILTCLDGAASGVTRNLILVGATNHANHVDAALIRPGRLERVIHVGHPETAEEREGIFRSHLQGDLADADISAIGQVSFDMTGADIMAVVRTARNRARLAGRALRVADLLRELVPAPRRSKADDYRCAVHEAGHAVAACTLGLPVDNVSIVERRGEGGRVAFDRTALPFMPTRIDLERWATSTLSGSAAEEMLLGTRSAGQGGDDGSDIAQATKVVAGLHASFGLGDALAYLCSPDRTGDLLLDDPELRRTVVADISRLYETALALVAARRDAVAWLAQELLSVRFMTGDQVRAGLERFHVPADGASTAVAPAMPAARASTGRGGGGGPKLRASKVTVGPPPASRPAAHCTRPGRRGGRLSPGGRPTQASKPDALSPASIVGAGRPVRCRPDTS